MGKNKMVVLMLVALIVWFPGRMTWNSRAGALEEADTARSRAADIELQISRALAADDAALRDRLASVQQAMPAQVDYQVLISKLRTAGAESGVQISSATLSDPDAEATPGGDPVTVNVQLSMTGTLSQIQRFMDLIVDTGWVATTDSVNLSFSDDGRVSASFPVAFYLWAPLNVGSVQ